MNIVKEDTLVEISVEGFTASAELVIRNRYNEIVVMSLIGYDSNIKNISSLIKSSNGMYRTDVSIKGSYRSLYIPNGTRNVSVKKVSKGISQLVMTMENMSDNGTSSLYWISEMDSKEELATLMYNKIYDNSDVPMIEDWKYFLYDTLEDRGYIRELYVSMYGEHQAGKMLVGQGITVSDSTIEDIISEGLRTGFIRISDDARITEEFKDIKGLDDYLDLFSPVIVKQIEDSFVPKFNPDKDEYSLLLNEYDQSCFESGIRLFEKQKEVIQAASNNLDKNSTTFVIGEMGTGRNDLRDLL